MFNESLEKHYYNVYSSKKHSDHERTFYLAISKNSTPRKVEIKGNGTLGKWSSCATVLPQPVDHQSIRDLENHLLAMQPKVSHHGLRHHQLCPPPHHSKVTISNKCRKQQKKKKRKKIADEGEDDEGRAKKYEENDDTVASKKKGKRRKKKPKSDEETVTTSAEADGDDEEI